MPPSPRYRPDPRHPSLGDEVFDVVTAARFPTLTLRYRNQRWAARVGLDTLTDDEWQAHFGRFEPLPDNLAAPLALRYHGHQFRTYNPALGDGRGFLFAQLRDDDDRLLDLATKGSGQTPWSRGGDGRLTLKGGVREVLATELLEALGVPTSKTFSLFETGEALRRNDEPSPTRASVLVRLGHSHVRFGSFQRLAYLGDRRTLRALVGYALAHYAPELCHLDDGDAAPALLRLVIARSARLCAAWMAAGFVHGVLNTDNLNVTGESFDYGPYRLLPVLDPGFTAAYFDHGGLYAYGAQPEAVRWALEQLAGALEVLAPDRDLGRLVAGFEPAYQRALDAAVIARLGLASRGALPDRLLRTGVLQLVHDSQLPFERLFFDGYGGAAAAARLARSPEASAYRGRAARAVLDELTAFAPRPTARLDHPYFADAAPCTLLIDELEALWAPIATRDDWAPLEAKLVAIRRMGDALAG
ncbi:MAG: YdiU family protein [Kofleriaceae bacterium]|nr:YdiU family protein [Kofleriaceae bacterium]MCB9570564.1 YdiU family protein [Kofleriaceae bacterium]